MIYTRDYGNPYKIYTFNELDLGARKQAYLIYVDYYKGSDLTPPDYIQYKHKAIREETLYYADGKHVEF